jgi:hypothetical protein
VIEIARKSKAEEWLTPDGLLRVKGWARDGLIDEQIAHNMGIGIRTLTDWKKQYPAISAALKEGKAPVDIEVENALLNSALGHTVKIRKPIKLRTKKQLRDKGTIEEERIEYAEEEIYIPPDVAACIFWLKNRRPDKWSDRPKEPGGERNALLESLYELARQDRG